MAQGDEWSGIEAWEHHQLHRAFSCLKTAGAVADGGDSALEQGFPDCGQCQIGCVVVLAQMAQEDVGETWRCDLGKKTGGGCIVHVTVVGGDACFQMHGVGAGGKHIAVVVALYDYVACLTHVVVNSRRYMSEVGCHGHGVVAVTDEESGVVCAVVAHVEGCDLEFADLKGK